MADQRHGGIAWTDESWNPIRGCSRISAGCTRCYAEVMAARFSDPGMPYHGLAKRTKDGPRWTGEVKLIHEHLYDPMRWKRPRRVFVNSMSDLFHEGLSDSDIDCVFGVMWGCEFIGRGSDIFEGHEFQVLTKRAKRMRDYLSTDRRQKWARVGANGDDALFEQIEDADHVHPRIWLGVSVEDQEAADERIPLLLETPAAVRWLSVEPQIGPVKLKPEWLAGLHWVVIGGESGKDARPFRLAWARSLLDQCKLAGVPAFMKQLGAKPLAQGNVLSIPLKFSDRKGGDMAEWPVDLRVREFPRAV